MKRKNAQKKRKKDLLRAKKSSKKSALRGIPLGALWGNFRGAKKWLRHVCAPRKCEEGVAVHLLHHLPLLPPPPPAPRLAPPLFQDFQGVRGRFVGNHKGRWIWGGRRGGVGPLAKYRRIYSKGELCV